jgi:hypothetical protein
VIPLLDATNINVAIQQNTKNECGCIWWGDGMTDRMDALWMAHVGSASGPEYAPPLRELRDRLQPFKFPDNKIDEIVVEVAYLLEIQVKWPIIQPIDSSLADIWNDLNKLSNHLNSALGIIMNLPISAQSALINSLPKGHPFYPGFSVTDQGLRFRTILSRDPESGLLGGEEGASLASVRDLLSILASHVSKQAARGKMQQERRRRPRRDPLIDAAVEAYAHVWASGHGFTAYARGQRQMFEKFLLVLLAKPPLNVPESTVLGAAKAYLRKIKPQREMATLVAQALALNKSPNGGDGGVVGVAPLHEPNRKKFPQEEG